MNMTTPLNKPHMMYDWKEERKGNLKCRLRISVSLRPQELWDGFGNRPEFSKINAQLFVSGVRVKSGIIPLDSAVVSKINSTMLAPWHGADGHPCFRTASKT